MKKGIYVGFSLTFLIICIEFTSCQKEENKANAPLEQELNLPETTFDYTKKHGINSDLATLGRVLFYDRNLSVNNAVACASCHKQEFAFSDNVVVNTGFNGMPLKRNSPSIQGIRSFFQLKNSFDKPSTMLASREKEAIRFNGNEESGDALLFWDGRQNSIRDMVLNPVLNHNEMGMPGFDALVNKLNKLSYYPALFTKAFESNEITKEKISFALEAFLACLNTETPFEFKDPSFTEEPPLLGDTTFVDEKNINNNGFVGPTFDEKGMFINPEDAELTELERTGKMLFHSKYNCAKCHDPGNQGSYSNVVSKVQMFNIGLDEQYRDKGLGALTGRPGDEGLFKTPTLQNISLTAPYMHDGRFANLSEVLDHYSHNIRPNVNLAPEFRNTDNSPKKLNISAAEKIAMIAFLNTLVNKDFVTNAMYSDPFKK